MWSWLQTTVEILLDGWVGIKIDTAVGMRITWESTLPYFFNSLFIFRWFLSFPDKTCQKKFLKQIFYFKFYRDVNPVENL